jgi:hypothetical protein
MPYKKNRILFVDNIRIDGNNIAAVNPNGDLILSANGTGVVRIGGAEVVTTASQSAAATNLAGGSSGSLVYQAASGLTTFLPIGVNGYILTSNGTTPQWVVASGLSAGTALTATNILSGTAGQLVYQIGPSNTGFIGPGTTGQLLVSQGTSAPVYTNTGSIYVGFAAQAEKLITARTINLGGDLSGSVNFDGSGNVTLTATIGLNSVALGSDTTGNYVATGSTSGFGITGSATGETSVFAINVNSTSSNSASTIVYRDGDGNFALNTLTVHGNILPAANGTVNLGSPSLRFGTLFVTSSTIDIGGNTLSITDGSLDVSGRLRISSGDFNTATSTANALYVAGGGFFEKSLVVKGDTILRGNVIFEGTSTYVFSTQTVYTDNLINVHTPPGSVGSNHTWALDDGKDIGFIFHYYKSTDKDAFLGLANDSGYLEWYADGTESSGVYIGTEYGTFKTGNIKLVGTDHATSTQTGSLQLAGGAGIQGKVFVGDTVTAPTFIGALQGNAATATTATNLSGGSSNSIPYQSAAGTTTFITAPSTASTYLGYDGSGYFWSSSVGPQGPQGPSGPSGANGYVGADGSTGPQGPQGPGFLYKGAYDNSYTYYSRDVVYYLGNSYISVADNNLNNTPGSNPGLYWDYLAVMGATGAEGPQGVQGPEGPQGVTGPQGPQGVTGPQGPQGVTGPQGPQGVTGPQGPQGVTGPQGPQGVTGPQGPQGVQGPQGPQGVTGPQGPQGVQGPQGPQGVQGPQGPQGVQGPQGPQGVTGPQGPQGAQGNVGPQGPQGVQGPQGPQGVTGPQGPQGVQGPQGPVGSRGPQGPQGVTGPQGPQGVQGPQGPQGVTGPQGPQGVQGPQGPQGVEGPQGPQGVTGPQGPQGVSGPKGETGEFGGASFNYDYSTTITASDPGAGVLRFDSLTFASVANIYIDQVDANADNITNFINTINASESDILGYVKVADKTTGTNFTFYAIASTVTNNTGWFTIPVSYLSNTVNSFPDGNDVVVTFAVTGNRGDAGPTGPQGVQGPQGPQGVTGPQGPQGVQGPQGPQGVQGPQGPQGVQGPQGPQGVTGPTGPAGADGTSVTIQGSVNTFNDLPGYPASYTGSVGDGYLDSSGDLWVWDGDSWNNVGAVRGPVGPQGPQGPQGVQGPQGATYTITVSTTPPVSPQAGELWWASDVGTMFFYYADGDSNQWVAATVAGGSIASPRYTLTTSTNGNINNNQTQNFDLVGYKSYALLKVYTSVAAWVRVYTDSASRTADSGRAITTDPGINAGIVAEVITTTTSTVLIAPATIGFNNETTVTNIIPIAVTNRTGIASAVSVTLTVLQMEI